MKIEKLTYIQRVELALQLPDGTPVTGGSVHETQGEGYRHILLMLHVPGVAIPDPPTQITLENELFSLQGTELGMNTAYVMYLRWEADVVPV